MTATAPSVGIAVDATLLEKIIRAGMNGLEMTGIKPCPVGASCLTSAPHDLTVIVSLIGNWNGTMAFNISTYGALFLTGLLLGEEQKELNEDTLDGTGEIGNIIAGSLKDYLEKSEFAFHSISTPSVIMGGNYNIYHYKGFTTVSVTFEIEEIPMCRMEDRYFTVTVSLMKS